jgi:hypothetical protein
VCVCVCVCVCVRVTFIESYLCDFLLNGMRVFVCIFCGMMCVCICVCEV